MESLFGWHFWRSPLVESPDSLVGGMATARRLSIPDLQSPEREA